MASPSEVRHDRGTPTESLIRAQLDRILASESFSRSKRLSDFLRFVVEETLDGRGPNLKEQVLASELYGKGADFDTAADSVVRVDARRLRDKLREYYSEFGQEPVVVSLPKGAYVPVFEASAAGPEVLPGSASPRRLQSRIIGALALLLVILAVGAYWSSRERPPLVSGASIAVLPLESLSSDPSQEYLADGITDALITDLAKIQALRVISRTSVLQFKRTKQPMGKIAAALGVDYVVEGSILPAGDRVRVTAQLVATKNERHLWAETYNRDQRDVLALQSEIAAAIAGQIKVRLTPQDQARLAPNHVPNSEALDAYLQGRFQWKKRTPEGLRKSLDYFKQAVAVDPNYALAWTGLADAYSILANYNLLLPNEAFPLSRTAAQRALQLDDNLAEAHAALANSANDPPSAEPEFIRAVDLNPNYAIARQWHAENLMFLGRIDDSVAEINKALELDPLSPLLRAVRAKIYYYSGRYDDAIKEERQALEMEPDVGDPGRVVVLSLAYAHKGMYAESISKLKAAGASAGDSADMNAPEVTAVLGYVYALADQRKEAERILVRLRNVRIEPYAMAGLTTALGKTDDAFLWLEKAYSERDTLVYMLKVDPDLASLRSDPRFGNLLNKLHMD